MLRAENEKLRSENITMRDAMKNASCPHCGGPTTMGEMSFDEQQLRIENARLKDEVLITFTGLEAMSSTRHIPSSPLWIPTDAM